MLRGYIIYGLACLARYLRGYGYVSPKLANAINKEIVSDYTEVLVNPHRSLERDPIIILSA